MEWKKYLLLAFGIFVAIGFGLPGATFLFQGGGDSSQPQQDISAAVPNQTFSTESYNLSIREQRFLGYRQNVVFINGFYSNRSQIDQFSFLKNYSDRFSGRVYVNLINNSESTMEYYFTELPKAVVVGGNPSYRSNPVSDVNDQKVSSEVCSAFRSIQVVAGECL
ncbi:MAG: hypothetical protein ABEJ83_02405 [Candidatus Nanohaloarchaea archaeon]